MKKLICLLLILFISVGYLNSAGTNAFEFTNIAVGCREIGMGEQGVAGSKGVSSLYWNPAGILENDGIEVNFMHNKWFQGIDEQFFGGIVPFRNYGFGISFYRLGVKPFKGYDNSGNQTGDVKSNASMLNFVFSKNFGIFKGGISLKQMQETLDDTSASSFGVDFGIRGRISENVSIGMGAQNFIAQKVKFIKEEFPVPLVYRVGFIYEKSVLKGDLLTLGIEWNSVADEDFNLSLGAEYKFKNFIFLRLGYLSEQDIGAKFRAGIGMRLRSWQVDYAFADYGDLGDTHRFSITWYYSDWKKVLEKTAKQKEERSLKEAKKLIKNGKYLEAVVNLEKWIRKYPDNEEFMKLLREAGEKIKNK